MAADDLLRGEPSTRARAGDEPLDYQTRGLSPVRGLVILVLVVAIAIAGVTIWNNLTTDRVGCSYSTENVDIDCGPNGAT